MRLSITVVALLVLSSSAFAHKLHVDARVDGDLVRVEAYHDDDTPAQEAKITVLDGEKLIAEGRTDDKGVWTFAKPGPGSYLVRAASVGHAAKTRLDIAAAPSPPPIPNQRKEVTNTPWRRIGMGLGIILGVSIVGLILRRSGSAKAAK
jgi:nickel transport protein